MRIFINDRPGHPFQIQLSRQLAAQGHEVLHCYGRFFQSPRGTLQKQANDPPSLRIVGLELPEPFQKYSFVKRLFQEIQYGRLLIPEIEQFQPDVVMFANTPSEAQWLVYRHFRRQKLPFVYWLQDVYGIAITKILRKRIPLLGNLVGQIYIWLDRQMLRQSAQIVLITEDFRPILQQWRIPDAKIHVIPNWAPIEGLPVGQKQNPWAVAHGLENNFCFLYSGTLGMKHNPDLLRQLAQQYQHQPEVRVVVISEGLGADWLAEQRDLGQLTNLVLLPYQPFNQFADVLATADVLVAILEPDAGVFSVPSKVLSYLCAQRPLLLAVPPENLAARIVQQQAAGLVNHPNDAAAFLTHAATLYTQPETRQQMGAAARTYAESQFAIDQITAQFSAILQRAIQG